MMTAEFLRRRASISERSALLMNGVCAIFLPGNPLVTLTMLDAMSIVKQR
jgi:hypothetical protein